jgi:hypothetical protein
MKKCNLTTILFLIFLNNFIIFDLESKIVNNILGKVGNSLITSVDLQNEIITNLLINKQDFSQENIESAKSYSVKNLIKKTIKKDEIDKYKIKDFNKEDLNKYIDKVAKEFDTNQSGLEEIFKKNNVNYSKFVERYKIELSWNTLIFQIYKNQINPNIMEIDNEIKKIKENKNDEELKKIRIEITNKKKNEQLNLFSRSHYSNLENSVYINFK